MNRYTLRILCAIFLLPFVTYGQTVYYVKSASGSDTYPGTSWAFPFKNLTRALAAANSSTAAEVQIWIADGIYTPVDGIASLPANVSDTSFAFYRGNGVGKALKIYGGFAGNETSISARDTVHTTYLDGYLGAKNSYHVVVIAGLAASADSVVIDRVTIQNGSASDENSKTYNGVSIIRNGGGGLYMAYNATAKIAVRNCVIQNDSAVGIKKGCYGIGGTAYGGGVYIKASSGRFDGCQIKSNVAKGNDGGCYPNSGGGGNGFGGGVYMDSSTVAVSNCTFFSNQVYGGSVVYSGPGGSSYGGGMYVANYSPSVINCIFNSNSAHGGYGTVFNNLFDYSAAYGGGLCSYKASPYIYNCSFFTNTVTSGTAYDNYSHNDYGMACGGGLANLYSSPNVVNCNFKYNVVSQMYSQTVIAALGGGIYNLSSRSAFANCSFSYNKAQSAFSAGGAVFNYLSPVSMTNCVMTANEVEMGRLYLDQYPGVHSGGGGIANDSSNAIFTRCTIRLNMTNYSSSNADGGGIVNSASSAPIFRNCVIDSNKTYGSGGAVYNTSSAPTFIKCSLSGNYSSSGGGAMYNSYSTAIVDTCTFEQNFSGVASLFYQEGGRIQQRQCLFNKNVSYSGAILVTGNGTQFSSFNNIYSYNAIGGAAISFDGNCVNCIDTLINNVFAYNSAPYTNGGALQLVGSKHIIYNNTFFADSAGKGGAISFEGTGGTFRVANNLFSNCYGAGATRDTSISGSGNFTFFNNIFSNTAPLFVNASNPIGPDGVWGTADDGLLLQACSPAVNAGSNAYVLSNGLYDITNRDRINNGIVDIGAYEASLLAPVTGATNMCVGSTATLTDTTSGGTWVSSDPNIATVSTAGVVTAKAQGNVIISYNVPLGCIIATANKVISVDRPAAAISGADSLCAGTAITLGDSAVNGTWTSSNPFVATVSATGVVTGIVHGTATITYTVNNGCGISNKSKIITVQQYVSRIVGNDTLCVGATTTLIDSVPGGTWVTNAPSVATIDNAGVVNALTPGTAFITYSIGHSTCGSSSAGFFINVQRTAAKIQGPDSVCFGTTITLTDSATGGVWSSSNIYTAAIGNTGIVTPVSPGPTVITYHVDNACGASSATKTIYSEQKAGQIDGLPNNICIGRTWILTDSAANGIWKSSNTAVASIDNKGVLTGLSQGITNITYSVTNSCGMSSVTAKVIVEIYAAPITGPESLCEGKVITLVDTTVNGTWLSDNNAVASVVAGTVTGRSAGNATISYYVSNSCGTSSVDHPVTVLSKAHCDSLTGVSPLPAISGIRVYPNPSNGIIHIEAPFDVNILLTGTDGKVYRQMNQAQELDIRDLPNGVYLLGIYNRHGNRVKMESVIKN